MLIMSWRNDKNDRNNITNQNKNDNDCGTMKSNNNKSNTNNKSGKVREREKMMIKNNEMKVMLMRELH